MLGDGEGDGFGIQLYRGVVVINDTTSYWAEDTAVPFVQHTFARNRFVQLNDSWHITSSEDLGDRKRGGASGDMWSKLQPLLDSLLVACREHYHPHQHLSIDEQMIAAQHHHSAVHLMPSKPARWGFKNFVICDAVTTYVMGFGKSETPHHQPCPPPRGSVPWLRPHHHHGQRLHVNGAGCAGARHGYELHRHTQAWSACPTASSWRRRHLRAACIVPTSKETLLQQRGATATWCFCSPLCTPQNSRARCSDA